MTNGGSGSQGLSGKDLIEGYVKHDAKVILTVVGMPAAFLFDCTVGLAAKGLSALTGGPKVPWFHASKTTWKAIKGIRVLPDRKKTSSP